MILSKTKFVGLYFLVQLIFCLIMHSARLIFFCEAIHFDAILLAFTQFLFYARPAVFLLLPKAICFPI
jgi:hypothetical protein